MAKRVGVSELLDLMKDRPLFDVRTPGEFASGHIPGACNMPLFSNEERARVGTTYKQTGPDSALLQGLDFVGPRMGDFVRMAKKEAKEGKLALHCWRGGKRSDSLGWLLEFAGFEVAVLKGGYKAYRRHLLDWFEKTPLNLMILGGHTGAGKTEILQELAAQGEQVVDLEGLAHHKGSAFGALGEAPQPTVEQFENDLFERFQQLDAGRPVWLENESRAIGRVYVPEGLWKQMKKAPLLHVDLPLEIRIKRLVDVYAVFDRRELIRSFEKIRKKLGGQHLQAALKALENNDYQEAAAIALGYYDKAYAHTLNSREQATIHHLNVSRDDPADTAGRIRASFGDQSCGNRATMKS